MNAKPKLWTKEELRKLFSELGNQRRAGADKDPRYKQLSDFMKDRATMRRWGKWQRLYDAVYQAEKHRYLHGGMTEAKAKKWAHQKAKAEVVQESLKTDRHIGKVIVPFD